MSEHYQLKQDLNEAARMADALQNYVRGPELYGSVGGGFFVSGSMPSLTIGALLLRLRRLHALRAGLDSAEVEKLRSAQQRHELVRRDWRHHYEEKMLREARSRLEAIRPFFKECADSPAKCPNLYRPELLRRTIVQELLRELEQLDLRDPEIIDLTRTIDGRLRSLVQPAPFYWDAALEGVYPPDEFWWLYARPPQEDDAENE